MTHDPLQCIVPADILFGLARHADPAVRDAALTTLQIDHLFRQARAESAARFGGRTMRPVTFAREGGQVQRTIYDQHHSQSQTLGTVARAEGQEPVADKSINQAYDGLGATYDYYWHIFQRDSIDGQGMPLLV